MRCREHRSVMLDTGMEKYGFIGWCRYMMNVKPVPQWMHKIAPVGDSEVPCACFAQANEKPVAMNHSEILSPYDVTR